MLCRIGLPALVIGLFACTDVPPVPGTGGTGGDGTGGTAGDGADGGTGGGGGTIDACSVVLVKEYSDLEPGDIAQAGVGIGQVEGTCPGSPCEGKDPIDRWAITTCGGPHQITLTWDDSAYDLDLFVYRSDDAQNWASQGVGTMEEAIVADLDSGRQYIIQVQAIDTLQGSKTYNVTADRAE